MKTKTRRDFLKNSLIAGVGMVSLPTILTRCTSTAKKNDNLIHIAQIGCGRMGSGDMGSTMAHTDLCRMVAVCDLDARRLAIAKSTIEEFYKKKELAGVEVKAYADFHDVISRSDIDAVIVSVPDHQHALVAIQAVLAGKDVYVQKPLTYSVSEAIALRKAVRAKQRILQTGSQQRSSKPWDTFRIASEAVRNGRVGKLNSIKIGVGLDRIKGVKPAPQPVPSNLDYERWLGPAPEQPYMELRVHPQDSIDGRPGWITTEDFGLGMITNWGAHHIDIAQWAMGMELSGPLSIEAKADFMQDDVWNVHTNYHVEMIYPNDVQVILDNNFTNGLLFEGTEGSVFCARGNQRVTKSDGNAQDAPVNKSLYASDDKILSSRIGPEGRIWIPSEDHYRNWLESIISRKDPVAPVDEAVRSLTTCSLSWIAMKLNRKLTWDPDKEQFINDQEAASMLERKSRKAEYDIMPVMKKAGLA
jgi:predicted dehydrogenase